MRISYNWWLGRIHKEWTNARIWFSQWLAVLPFVTFTWLICIFACVFVCGGVVVHACHSVHVEARGFGYLLQPCRSQGSNSDHQALQNISSLLEPSCRSDDSIPCIFYWETFHSLSVTARLPFMVHGCQGSVSFYSHYVMCFSSAACAPKEDRSLLCPSPLSPLLHAPAFASPPSFLFLFLSFLWEMNSCTLHQLCIWTHLAVKDDLELPMHSTSGIIGVHQNTQFAQFMQFMQNWKLGSEFFVQLR